jgi:alpha-L-arabinofuranosidase
MKRIASILASILFAGTVSAEQVFFYSPDSRAGLHIAYLDGAKKWQEVCQLCQSDYSQWGAEKRMIDPYIHRGYDGAWRVVWQVNDYAPTFAAAYSEDLVTWRPQDYPRLTVGGCKNPVIEREGELYAVYYEAKDGVRKVVASTDFRHFGKDEKAEARPSVKRDTVEVGGKKFAGQVFSVSSKELEKLRQFHKEQETNRQLWTETLKEDSAKLLGKIETKEVDGKATAFATLTVRETEKKISDKLIGIFFEDISYAADGGLYAEMVQNRDFEYNGERKGWDAQTAWKSSAGKLTISTDKPLSANNPHYAVVADETITNEGWDGMAVKQGDEYYFTLFANAIDSKAKELTVRIEAEGKTVAETTVKIKKGGWTRYEKKMTATATAKNARLTVSGKGKAKVGIDIVSLFPKDTYKGRRNGLRKDIAEAIAALKPKFVRFPGGCMTHGQGIDNIYHWHETIGALQDRKPDMNIWHYHQTRGLGFYEFFQWCEDMGAEPLPVLAAGVPCQNSAADKTGMGGQQGGIPMEKMEEYSQEFLDLIEWANGDPATSKWAKMRAEAGHPEPFNLKYIGVGNEDLLSTTFEDRMLMISKVIKEKYPEIEICGTVGPFHTPSSDYIEGWKFANEHRDIIDMVDEHYYESPGWFLNNQHYYDSYDREAPKVYLGEYSVQSRVRRSDVEAALCEAIHLCNLERNADVVVMSSYAPLLCNTLHGNWNPDMIYFKGNEAPQLTPSYETQKLFGNHSGDRYVETEVEAADIVRHRVVASIVRDSKSGKKYLKVVNALPVQVKMTCRQLGAGKEYKAEGFKGKPVDRKVESVRTTIKTDSESRITLEPYSFHVVEL